jgi:hypothetical protein
MHRSPSAVSICRHCVAAYSDAYLCTAGRSLVFRMSARFTDPVRLQKGKYDDSHKDGIFPRDPTLKDFLA